VFSRSKRSSDGLFTVLARSNDETGPRLGLAISKRAAKRAVQRNRLKRIARETFRTQSGLASMDFVVMAGPTAKDASNGALRASLEAHFARLSQRSGPPSHG
jgi:ribonuclease P protein component